MNWFTGKKTYIVAALAGISTIAYCLGYIEIGTLAKIDAILAPFGLAFLRAGINNSWLEEEAVVEAETG